MKWIYRLDYKYGRHYIPNLMAIIVAGMVVVWLGSTMYPQLPYWLVLSREGLLNLELWRLVTFLFIPPSGSGIIFTVIGMLFYYFVGTTLQGVWGGFRFNLYYLIGMVLCWVSALITGYAGNGALNLTMFLAFATVSPDSQVRLYFVLPIKVKWMGIAYAILMVWGIISAFFTSVPYGVQQLVSTLLMLGNYFLFLGPQLFELIGNQWRMWRNRRRWRRR